MARKPKSQNCDWLCDQPLYDRIFRYVGRYDEYREYHHRVHHALYWTRPSDRDFDVTLRSGSSYRHADPRYHADHPEFCVFDSGGDVVGYRQGPWTDFGDYLRDSSNDQADKFGDSLS